VVDNGISTSNDGIYGPRGTQDAAGRGRQRRSRQDSELAGPTGRIQRTAFSQVEEDTLHGHRRRSQSASDQDIGQSHYGRQRQAGPSSIRSLGHDNGSSVQRRGSCPASAGSSAETRQRDTRRSERLVEGARIHARSEVRGGRPNGGYRLRLVGCSNPRQGELWRIRSFRRWQR
jgi:hypothetical protein